MTSTEAPATTTTAAAAPAASPQLSEEELAKKRRKEEARKAAKAAKQAKFDAKKAKQQQQQAAAASSEKKKQQQQPKKEKPSPAAAAAAAPAVKPGEKKDVRAAEMAAGYHPPSVEAGWYAWWEKAGFFKPSAEEEEKRRESFVIVIPPPNVTGMLHLGHALTNSIQDALVRWHRMLGHRTLWVPGTDHAGISTQVVVEKKLMRERGLTRHDVGREAFVAEVWKWQAEYGGNIEQQLRRIGSSIDWDREVFTMDEVRSRAVTEAFVRLHDAGLVYRDNRLVNWCCTLRTAISDIEVEYIDVPEPTRIRVPGHEKPVPFGELVHFAYKVEGSSSEEEVVCATTRIETMIADTAVAIHPDDARYKHLHGKFVIHPLSGRRIPIVCDGKLVDPAFGTGCVKVTPAHDPNDYECGQRNHLEIINMFNDEGLLTEACGKFAGMKRFEARQAVLEELKKLGSYRKTTPNPMRIALCSRSKDVIEPRLVPQWYVNCKQAAAQSCAAVREGRIEIVPKIFEQDWFHWLENIRDWCVSRQLWWGHRVPAYLVTIKGRPAPNPMDNESWAVARSEEEARKRAAAKFGVPEEDITLSQDPDVLDTWFSSGLFPFSVFGWPDNTEDLAQFFPTTLLETGSDILFFWVARMVMMSLMLTGREPFSHVMLHAMVRDAHGRKMSKTLGNVIDPIDVIQGITLEKLHEKLLHGNLAKEEVERARAGQKADFPNGIAECGTDAMRFALCAYTSQARDINLDINRVVGYRNFCNKIWNAVRFSLSKLGADFAPAPAPVAVPAKGASHMDRWILSKLAKAVHDANAALSAYDLSSATSALHSFWLYDLCDVYLESIKPLFGSKAANHTDDERAATREALYTCVESGLRLLHPFMPFVTEELWQRLPQRPSAASPASIMLAPYPIDAAGYATLANPEVEGDVAMMLDIVHAARRLNAPYIQDIKKRGKKPKIYYRARNAKLAALLDPAGPYAEELRELCQNADGLLQPLAQDAPAPAGAAVEILGDSCEVYSELRGIIDVEAEIAKLEKRRQAAEAELEQLRKKAADPLFETKTPIEVRDATRAKMATIEEELRLSTATAASLASMRS